MASGKGHEERHITPTLRHARACIHAGAVVALDATDRLRPDGRTFEETVAALRASRRAEIMADCADYGRYRRAVAAGFDVSSHAL